MFEGRLVDLCHLLGPLADLRPDSVNLAELWRSSGPLGGRGGSLAKLEKLQLR